MAFEFNVNYFVYFLAIAFKELIKLTISRAKFDLYDVKIKRWFKNTFKPYRVLIQLAIVKSLFIFDMSHWI